MHWKQELEVNPAAKALPHALSAFIVHETMPKVCQYLKGYCLEFPQQFNIYLHKIYIVLLVISNLEITKIYRKTKIGDINTTAFL